MKKYLLFNITLLALIAGIGTATAQFVVKDTYFNTTGVSNQGAVAGYEAWGGPYSVWHPETNTTGIIGGAAPGNGVGGAANFSVDGSKISGSNYVTYQLNPVWERDVLTDFNYIFKSIIFPVGQTQQGFAAGQSVTYNGDGIILKTDDGGANWYPVWVDESNHGLEAMSFPDNYTGYVGGWNAYFAKTEDGGSTWNPVSPGTDVYIYTGIAFKDYASGVVTAQLNDGAAIYITSDGGLNWTTGSGLSAIPNKVTYAGGDTYYLVTNGGEIQKSTNNGLTWTTVYDITDMLLGIRFFDEFTGIATGETYIYKTTDGGSTWTQSSVSPETNGVLWRDVEWVNSGHLFITGTPDVIYESTDGGASWTFANEDLYNGLPALYEIAVTETDIHVCGSQGTFYNKSLITSYDIAGMAVYDVASEEWTQLGSLGFTVDGSVSGSYNISGDGSTVVGNAWASPSHAQGVAWNEEEGLIDLGTLYAGRSSRANAVSQDGSVIVGYQDFNGPWKSAVWRKNPAGGYFPNEYLLIDPNGSSNDEYNQLGYASAVSGDGNWIGGHGDYANNNEAWIWSEGTGYLSLGSVSGGTGRVAGINYDGSVVVGWIEVGMWDPSIPFIWTPKGGLINLNTYITDSLGYTLGDKIIYSADAISPNGKYITGWGLDPTIGWGEYFTYRLEMEGGVTPTSEDPIANIRLYPNPVKGKMTISSDTEIESLEIYNICGQLIHNQQVLAKDYSSDMTGYKSGVYMIKVITGNTTQIYKVVKE